MNHSKIPLRLATMLGLFSAALSLVAAAAYLVMKLVFWSNLPIGIAPIIIGMFFIASVQLLFLGVLGEYVGSIYTQVRNRPLVVERERINFDEQESEQDGTTLH
jgi:cell shape-determining protein MreD